MGWMDGCNDWVGLDWVMSGHVMSCWFSRLGLWNHFTRHAFYFLSHASAWCGVWGNGGNLPDIWILTDGLYFSFLKGKINGLDEGGLWIGWDGGTPNQRMDGWV